MPGDHTASLAYFTPEMNRIYLDNAATSFPKPLEVWEAVVEQGREVGANAGRSAYRSAQATDSVIDENAGGMLLNTAGWTDLLLPLGDGSAYIVN